MTRTTNLLLISFLSLFYELTFIRYLPANVVSIAYFSNIVLISCFFGQGLGYLVPQKKVDLFRHFPWLLVCILTLFILFRNLDVMMPENSGEWIWSSYSGNISYLPGMKLGIIPTLLLVFCLNALLFVPIGQMTCALMEKFPPLVAYTINIVGSILGIAAFSLFSYFYRASFMPMGWFLVGGILLLFLGFRRKDLWRFTFVGALILPGLVMWNSAGERWSPYYDIQVKQNPDQSLKLYVNRFFHQQAVNFSQNPQALEKYRIPYTLRIPNRLLILGAGTGNDVAVAEMCGVRQIDAVEIDPEIYAIGKAMHPQKPYDHPNVNVFIDDARSYLRQSTGLYDMIILGTLDSHALLSGMSNIRLDNFVYTKECMEDVRKRLDEKGMVILMFSVPKEWLGRKLVGMVHEVFPDNCYLANIQDAYLFNLMVVAGPGAKALIESRSPGGVSFYKLEGSADARGNLPTDDWPYLYLSARRIPVYYLEIIGLLLVITVSTVLLVTTEKSKNINFTFLFLGAAFLLLETKSVTTLSLLFGSTWMVNASVFLAILFMILLANLTVQSVRLPNIKVIYGLLFLSLLLNYFVPLDCFLGQQFLVKALAPPFLVALPIFFAGIIFASLLRTTTNLGMVYGSNLIGCVLGGFCEYASMIIGLRCLFILAAVLYLVAMISAGARFGSREV